MRTDATRQVSPQARYRTLIIIWGAILMNVVLLFALSTFIAPDPSKLKENNVLTLALTLLGTLMMAASYFFRQRMLARAIEQQRPESLSGAYIVAFAMSEFAALCGMLIRFTTNERFYYFLFIVAVLGLVLNVPRKSDVVDALSEKRL